MSDVSAPHLLSPEPGVIDGHGRRWCALCRLPEDNRCHVLRVVSDPTKNRILGEADDAQTD